jgi:putative endonuclease
MAVMKGGWVYIMTNRRNGTLYVGVTNDIVRRAYEHRTGALAGFTKRYGLHRLVWFEWHEDIRWAIQREKHQGMAARVEVQTDRPQQSRMARSLS